MVGVLVDDDDTAAGPNDAARLVDRALDVDGMLQRFGRVGRIERVWKRMAARSWSRQQVRMSETGPL